MAGLVHGTPTESLGWHGNTAVISSSSPHRVMMPAYKKGNWVLQAGKNAQKSPTGEVIKVPVGPRSGEEGASRIRSS
jgi:hypothetical protein